MKSFVATGRCTVIAFVVLGSACSSSVAPGRVLMVGDSLLLEARPTIAHAFRDGWTVKVAAKQGAPTCELFAILKAELARATERPDTIVLESFGNPGIGKACTSARERRLGTAAYYRRFRTDVRAMFRVGVVDPAKFAESERTGEPLPSLHSSKFAPVPEPTIKTGVTALMAAALDLLAKK